MSTTSFVHSAELETPSRDISTPLSDGACASSLELTSIVPAKSPLGVAGVQPLLSDGGGMREIALFHSVSMPSLFTNALL